MCCLTPEWRFVLLRALMHCRGRSKFPPNTRVVVTVRAPPKSTELKNSIAKLTNPLVHLVPGVPSGIAQRMMFMHMERCRFGEQHVSDVQFQNPYHRAGQLSRFGDLEEEDVAATRHICAERIPTVEGTHVQAAMMLGACAALASFSEVLSPFENTFFVSEGYHARPPVTSWMVR